MARSRSAQTIDFSTHAVTQGGPWRADSPEPPPGASAATWMPWAIALSPSSDSLDYAALGSIPVDQCLTDLEHPWPGPWLIFALKDASQLSMAVLPGLRVGDGNQRGPNSLTALRSPAGVSVCGSPLQLAFQPDSACWRQAGPGCGAFAAWS